MPIYVVQCRLNNPGQNAAAIDASLRTLDDCLSPFPGTWIVQGATTAKMLRNVLVEHLSADDGLLITRAGNEAGWEHLDREIEAWLTDRFTREESTDITR